METLIVASTRCVWLLGNLTHQALLAYFMLPTGRGAYAACIAFAFLLSICLTLSIETGAQFYSMAKRISLSKSLVSALGVCLLGSLATIAVALPLIYSDLDFFQKADTRAFELALILVPLQTCGTSLLLQLLGFRRFIPHLFLALMELLVVILGVIVLVWKMEKGVEGAILALIAAQSVTLLFQCWYLRKRMGLRFELPSRNEFSQILGYGLRVHATRIGLECERYLGIFVLGVLATVEDIGFFALGSLIMLRLTFIPSSMEMVLHPRIVDNAPASLGMFGAVLRLACLITAGALLLVLSFSEPLVRILFSQAFLPVIPLMWILAPGLIGYLTAAYFMKYFSAVNRPGLCSWSMCFGIICNALIISLLYPSYGPVSVSWGLSGGMMARGLFLAFMFHRATGLTLASAWLPRWSDFTYLYSACRSLLLRFSGRNEAKGIP